MDIFLGYLENRRGCGGDEIVEGWGGRRPDTVGGVLVIVLKGAWCACAWHGLFRALSPDLLSSMLQCHS